MPSKKKPGNPPADTEAKSKPEATATAEPAPAKQPKTEGTIPEDFQRQALKKELANLIAKLNGGEVINRAERLRMHALSRYFANDPDKFHTPAALEAGAFKELKSVRGSKEEIATRVCLVAEWIIANWKRPEILREAAILWAICKRSTDELIKRAYAEIAKARQKRLESVVGRLGEQYQEIYRLSKGAGEFGYALQALDGEAKLEGSCKPVVQRYEFAGDGVEPIGILTGPAKGSIKPGA